MRLESRGGRGERDSRGGRGARGAGLLPCAEGVGGGEVAQGGGGGEASPGQALRRAIAPTVVQVVDTLDVEIGERLGHKLELWPVHGFLFPRTIYYYLTCHILLRQTNRFRSTSVHSYDSFCCKKLLFVVSRYLNLL